MLYAKRHAPIAESSPVKANMRGDVAVHQTAALKALAH